MRERTYLDWNATAPLCPEAREAMIAAMDVAGNPSSVHGEGRAAKALVERARAQVAALVGCNPAEVVFTSGATEAAGLGLGQGPGGQGSPPMFGASDVEHDCIRGWCDPVFKPDRAGTITLGERVDRVALQLANSETGVMQDLPRGLGFSDIVQGVGKVPFDFAGTGIARACVSSHKFGGPKGIGALIIRDGMDVAAQIRGGGQEMGRRSGTENIIGIAGFGAAAAAAARNVEDETWDRVAQLRTFLETSLEGGDSPTILVGKDSKRLPNTSCLITPGWTGETQVMALDLAGFAVSAGSACSSGKVRSSAVLTAMGYGPGEADCAIRVSLGPTTTDEQVGRFVESFRRLRDRRRV